MNMMAVRQATLAAGLLSVCIACGAAAPETAKTAAAPELDKGAQCLEDARAPREPAADAPPKIEVAHILVRHVELADPRGSTRTPKQACLRALEALEHLKQGQDWSEVVKQYSDSKQDALGRVSRDELSPRFGDAAFALKVNQLSYVVESDRGFHIILRKD